MADRVRAGGAEGRSFLLLALFILSLSLSLAAAQVLGGVLILAALGAPGPGRGRVRSAWWVAALYVGALSAVSGLAAGLEGVVSGVRNTWPILIAPAAAVLGATQSPRSLHLLKRLLVLSLSLAAALFLVQWAVGDPAAEGRYGCHRSPYAFAMLLIPASLLVLADPGARRRGYAAWALLLAALIITKSRGPFLAWLTASAVLAVVLAGSFRWRRLLVPGLLLVILLLLLMPSDRWELDLSRQYSVQHRLVIWNVIVPEIEERPWLGHGFDRFVADPQDAPQFADWLRNQTNPHNGYLMILHAAGAVGALILVVAYGTMLGMLFFRRRESPDPALVAAAAAHLCGILVAALADKTFFVTLVMLQCWFLAGLALSTRAARPSVAA